LEASVKAHDEEDAGCDTEFRMNLAMQSASDLRTKAENLLSLE
jgi:hypothetical protein